MGEIPLGIRVKSNVVTLKEFTEDGMFRVIGATREIDEKVVREELQNLVEREILVRTDDGYVLSRDEGAWGKREALINEIEEAYG